MLEGKIIKGIGGFYYVKTVDGIYSCRARGKFRNKSLTPMVGDIVNIDVTDTEKREGYVVDIHERINELFRPLVSNIDLLLVTFAVESPNPSFGLIDKLIVTAESRNIPVAVCINKCDLDEEKAREYARNYELSGYPVIMCSAETGKNTDALRQLLRDKTTALAGNSGVGKSSLLNAIGESFNLKTGSVSEKIQRGKHTTRHTELFPLSFGGYVLDTPGFGSYEIDRISYKDLPSLFPEISRHEGGCRFTGCSHIKEPDCSVKDALFAGKISKSRYESFCELYEQLKQIKEWE